MPKSKTAKDKTVFLVEGHSESGDLYTQIFSKKPTPEELSELAHGWDGSSDKDGPGFDGSWVHLVVSGQQVTSPPSPSKRKR